MRVNTLLSVAAIAAFAASAGCIGSPAPSEKLFVLPTTAPGGAGPREGLLRDRSLGLGPVTIASHLDRRSVAVRLDETRYEYADSMHWASPLDLLIQERLMEGLVWATGTRDIRPFPWVAGRAPDVQVAARFVRFELTPEGSADLSVYWQIRDGLTGEQLSSGRFEHQEPIRGASANAGVEALDRGLLLLAETLTRAMRD
jgi:uncharacterized lipoprotein YmbA